MPTEDWKTYLVFCVDQDGRSIFSPQDPNRTKFYLKRAADFSDDDQSRAQFESNLSYVFETGRPSKSFNWSARYDDETVRHYSVDLMPINEHLAMVLLYRDELREMDLTETEISVLQLLANDKTNSAIASELAVAESTVRTHVANLRSKLGVDGRVRLGIEAYRLGLVET